MLAEGREGRRVALLLACVCLLAGAGRASGVSAGGDASDQELGPGRDAPVREAWSSTGMQINPAAKDSRRDASAIQVTDSIAAGTKGAHRIYRFCAAAAPRCASAAPSAAKAKTASAAVMARKVKPTEAETAAAASSTAAAELGLAQARGMPAVKKGQARPRAEAPETAAAANSPGAVTAHGAVEGRPEAVRASGRWGGPLTRLRHRLAELENKLHKTVTANKAYMFLPSSKQMVSRLGRRLLASADEGARAFPDSFYQSFGGLPQLAGVSASVLRSVEDQICGIYTAMCSSLASMAALDGAPVPLHTERSLWQKFFKVPFK